MKKGDFFAHFCCSEGMFGAQKHHFKVMAGKSKGTCCPKILFRFLCACIKFQAMFKSHMMTAASQTTSNGLLPKRSK
jgi:hypothetical protein